MPAVGSRFARLFQRLLGSEETKSLAAPEPWLAEIFGIAANNLITVTPSTAMQCTPVRAAVQSVAEACAQLPVHVFRRGDSGVKERVKDHPACRLLHNRVNEGQGASSFREEMTRDALLYPHGAFAHIVRNSDGKPIELYRIDQEVAPVTVDRSNFEPIYSIAQKSGPAKIIPRQNIFHLPSPSLNGRGLVHEGGNAIRLALVLERHALRLFEAGAKPSGVLSVKGARDRAGATTPTPGAVSLDKIKEAFATIDTPANSGKTIVLPGDYEWKQITLTNLDSQFIELRQFAIAELARVFRVSPIFLMDYGRATWSNSGEMGRQFLTYSLMPWLRRWVEEIQIKLIRPEDSELYFAEFKTDAIAQIDIEKRYDAYTKAITSRILSPNEVRALENLPPYSGGDTYENPNTSSAPANSEAAR